MTDDAESTNTRGGNVRLGEALSPSEALRWIGGMGIVIVAILRCCVVFASQPAFDDDPVHLPALLAGLGPAGSLWLDVVLLLAAGAALLGEALTDRGVRGWFVLAMVLPVPVIVYHAIGDAGDLWRSSTWLAGMAAAVAIAHLARDRTFRITLAALLLAVIAPLVVRGVAQVTMEHAITIEDYFDHGGRERVLASHGWEEGSTAALLYERRLTQPEASGWFGLANIYGSFMAFSLVAGLGLLLASVRGKLPGGWSGVAGLMALASGAGLWLCGSKGAVGAALVGLVLLAAVAFLPISRRIFAKFGGAVAVGAIAVALFAIVARGSMLEEGFLGEKSLLFRWQYLVATNHIVQQNAWLGVGADGFQQAYVLARDGRSPEEIVSAHSVFADWIAMLGVLGLAWTALLVRMAWRAGESLPGDDSVVREEADATDTRGAPAGGTPLRMLTPVLVVVVLGLLPAIYLERPALSPVAGLVRIIGVVGYAALALVIAGILWRGRSSIAWWGIAAGAITIIVHGQIEMTFFPPGSVVLALCLMGLASRVPRGGGRWPGLAGGGALAVLALALAAGSAWPAWRQSAAVKSAAIPLIDLGQSYLLMTTPGADYGDATDLAAALLDSNDVDPALVASVRALDSAVDEAAWRGQMRRVLEELQVIELSWRLRAAGELEDAASRWPSNTAPLLAAAEQRATVAMRRDDDVTTGLLREAKSLAERAHERQGRTRALALAADLAGTIALREGIDADAEIAITLHRRLTELDPHGLAGWVRLGDLYWDLQRPRDAAFAYRKALSVDANLELDPIKQLSDGERTRLTERMDAAIEQDPAAWDGEG